MEMFFFARPLVCLALTLPTAGFSRLSTVQFGALFAAPPIIELHGCYIWLSNGALELWPMILGLDIALFWPSISFYNRLVRKRVG
jgi:hypothetical protein